MEGRTPFYIPAHRTTDSRLHEVDWDNLVFGKHNSDHMLVCDYTDGQWQTPQVLPFGNFSLSPATLSLHYGQTIFEGMKAFRMEDGRINIFRPQKHYDRFVLSADRLCMPVVSQEVFQEGLRRLVAIDKNWVPGQAGSALYIRPFMIATESRLRVKVSESYRFCIMTTPTGPYYEQPIRVKVETDFVRAVRGGEESGVMNIFFVIGDTLVTPPFSDSILDGVTRNSLITLAGSAGIPVAERPLSVDELQEALMKGQVHEAFGSGTAAVVSPIGTVGIAGTDYRLPPVGQDNISHLLRTGLENIRYGRVPDPYGWNFIV